MARLSLRSLLYAGLFLALWGTPSVAMALSSGATFIVGLSGSIDMSTNIGLSFDQGEVITVVFTNPVGSTSTEARLDNMFHGGTYNDVHTSNVFPAEYTFTVPSTGLYRFQVLAASGLPPVGRATMVITVVAPPASADASAFANTVASASRGQTSVIMGNIMSRTEIASKGIPPQEGRGRDVASSFDRSVLHPGEEQSQAGKFSLRELAEFASFNTAQSVIAAADPSVSGTRQRRGIGTNEPFTLWGHASFTSADNDFNKNGNDNRYDSDVWGYSLGADFRFNEKAIAGLSVGYADTDVTTTYNAGKYEEDSWSFSPYIMYEPVDGALVSFVAGYSFGDVDRKRNSTVTGNTDSAMWYAAIDGEYKMQPSDSIPLDLTARLGYLLSEKTLDAFTESDGTRVAKASVDTSQIKPGVEAAYSFNALGTVIQPFVKADYVQDFVDEINDDSNALYLGGGLRILSGETGLSGVIEGERQFLRDDYSEYAIKGFLAYNFDLKGDDGNSLGTLAPFVKSDLDADGGQVFGSGLKFTSADESLSCGLEATHTLSSEAAGNIGAQLNFEMTY